MGKHSYDTEEEVAPRTTRSAAVLRSPDEWRVLLSIRASSHACARQLHAWHVHEYHEGAPMRLTESAYREALAAAQSPACEPSHNALSPHVGKGI